MFDEALREELAGTTYDSVRKKSYIALDVHSLPAALDIVNTLGVGVDGYKVGLELFHATGPVVLEELAKRNKRVFLDVKLHDIPNTVASALRSICSHEIVEMVNVHALGGPLMLQRAREAVDTASPGTRPKLIGVTLLTSMRPMDAAAVGLEGTAEQIVLSLVQLAIEAKLDGVVASALELRRIASVAPSGFLTVIPGTRPKGADAHDQVRVLTPGEAVARGASHLVLGRAVTKAVHPLQALKNIWDDMLFFGG